MNLSNLDRKLFRDLRRMKGQALAVALVVACGLAMMIMSRSLIYSLESTRAEYYEANRFGEVFVRLKRAPKSLVARIAEIPGVAAVEAGIGVQVTLDLAGVDEPASGMVHSLPDLRPPELNRLFLRSGRWLTTHGKGEVLVGEAFADANGLRPGNHLSLLLNGRRQTLQIVGIVLSPEYIFESRPGTALPDNRTYGVFWMPYAEVAAAYDLDGAFNSLSLALSPGASDKPVIVELDRLLQPYGGRGAYGRADHPSHIRVSDEIRVLRTLSIGFPTVFLSVAAFMTNAVLTRLLAIQREQIAVLKAFGFTNRQIAGHYLKFAFMIVSLGTFAGGFAGAALGHRIVGLYHIFFRFPELNFRLDRSSLLVAVVVSAGAAMAGVFSAVRRAARLPPAEAMRPEPPSNYKPSFLERAGVASFFAHTFRIAVRNLERKPVQALFTISGLAMATGILIIPNCFRDGIDAVLNFQWDVIQRQDLSVGLVEPASNVVRHNFEHLPGVVDVEPFRYAPVRIGFGNLNRQLVIQGLPTAGRHNRVIDAGNHQLPLPPTGIVISGKLAEALGVQVGDMLDVKVLEGKRATKTAPLVGLAEDFAGVAAYMDIRALNRLLDEGDVITGATLTVDKARERVFLRALKGIPRVGWIAIKESLRSSFRKTTAASLSLLRKIYAAFATIVAFGVVYNARISLAERARELATLRVIGFSRREVGSVLVIELVLVSMVAVPIGLAVGIGFARVILRAINTETVRLPFVLTLSNCTFAVMIVTIASTLSALAALWKLNHLDLVGVLKAPE